MHFQLDCGLNEDFILVKNELILVYVCMYVCICVALYKTETEKDKTKKQERKSYYVLLLYVLYALFTSTHPPHFGCVMICL